MSSSSIQLPVFQAKIGSIQNQADSTSVYSAGVWSFKNSTALTSVTITDAGAVTLGPSGYTGKHTVNGGVAVGGSLGLSNYLEVNSGANYGNIAAFRSLTGTNPYFLITTSANKITLNADGSSASAVDFQSGAAYVGGYSTGGAWTLGPSSGGAVHTIQSPGNGAGSASLHVRKGVAINASGNSYIEFYGASGGYDGWLGVSGTTLQVVDASDSRKKENVRPANYGLKEIKELKPVVYDWKEEFGGEKDIKGFLAQEVKQVLPECVTTKDETEVGGFEDAHYLGTANMIPVLVAAIQELSAKNDALEARLAALEAKP